MSISDIDTMTLLEVSILKNVVSLRYGGLFMMGHCMDVEKSKEYKYILDRCEKRIDSILNDLTDDWSEEFQ